MQNYKTIEEKAAEWNVSMRHIQYLCRTGRIEGAVKRARSWFIPEGAPVPTKNTKSDIKNFKFVGTKNKIFNTSIELFMLKGFTNVSFKDIADKVGIRQSSIYSHFKSKQEILDTIYDFYCYYFTIDRLSLKDMEPILQKESLMGIIKYIRYEFKEDYRQTMVDITKIIFQRISTDDRSKEIVRSLIIDDGIKYIEDVFNNAIEMGRLASFNTHTMAIFINMIAVFTLYYWTIDSSHDSKMRLLEAEQEMYQYAINFLTDLKAS